LRTSAAAGDTCARYSSSSSRWVFRTRSRLEQIGARPHPRESLLALRELQHLAGQPIAFAEALAIVVVIIGVFVVVVLLVVD
jgi:hypothetical protein